MPQYKGTKRLATPTARKALGLGPKQRVTTEDWISSDRGALGADRNPQGPRGGKTQAQARYAGTRVYRKAQMQSKAISGQRGKTYVDAKKKLPSRKRNG